VVIVTDAQGKGVQNATINWTVTAGSATLSSSSAVTGSDGKAQVSVTAGPVAGNISVQATLTGFNPVVFSLQSRLPGPSLTAAGFSDYTTGESALVPGALAYIRGTGLFPAALNPGTYNSDVLHGTLPLSVSGLTVVFISANGQNDYAPIYRVSKEGSVESLVIQVPWEIQGSTVTCQVTNGGSATVTNIPVKAILPGVLEDLIDSRRAAVAIRSDGLLVTKATPARRGETIRLYVTGVGQTSPTASTNRVGVPGQKALASVLVGLNDVPAEVLSADLAENLFGIFEITFKVMPDATTGPDRPIGIVVQTSAGQSYWSNGSVIPIAAQ
jgi:uncharacterized protein (TIGR03437 family)